MKSPRLGVQRASWQSPGSISQLPIALGSEISDRVAVLVSASLPTVTRAELQRLILGKSDVYEVPSALTFSDIERLRELINDYRFVVGVGGGNVMDAAKSVCRPGDARLVLVPTTLSGSEHSAVTSWWEDGGKAALPVGFADAVISDPDLLVTSVTVLRCGAMHAIAHCLATAAQTDSIEWQVEVSAHAMCTLSSVLALKDAELIRARYLLARGAWNAAVAYISTGPVLSAHHWVVHKLARAGEHALFSAFLLAKSAALSELHDYAVGRLAFYSPRLREKYVRLGRGWIPEPTPLPRSGVDLTPPDEMQEEVKALLDVI